MFTVKGSKPGFREIMAKLPYPEWIETVFETIEAAEAYGEKLRKHYEVVEITAT